MKKQKRKLVALYIIILLLMSVQVLGYLGSESKELPDFSFDITTLAFYFGFNLFLFVSLILFMWIIRIKRKMRRIEETEMIESLGSTLIT